MLMELLLARNELNEKPKKVKLDKLKDEVIKAGEKIFYFDKDNSHKELKSLIEYFEDREYSVYMREVKFGLNDDEYIYEVHIVK
jgi:hypothetical protein